VKPSYLENNNLTDRTRQVWQSRLGRDLSREDARQIAENVTGFFAILAEWWHAERRAANDNDGRRAGGTWMARCPEHDDRVPSLAITHARDSKVLVRCHAGCNQQDVIAALRARGVWDAGEQCPIRFSRNPDREPPREADSDVTKRTEAALAI
jgi:hypothetical protein